MKLLNCFKSDSKLRSILSERRNGLQFLVYNLSGNGLTLLLNFILPIYLTAVGYGEFALLYALYNLFTAIFTFGLDSSILKFSLDKKVRSNVLTQSFFVWLLLSALAFMLIIPITWICANQNILKVSFEAAIITIFSAFLISFQRIVLYYYIAKSEVKKYGFLFVSNKVLQCLIFLLAVVFFTEGKSLGLMPFLFLIQSIATVLLILFLERKNWSYSLPSKNEMRYLTKFTLPLTLETFGNIGYSYGFNLLISPFLSLSQLGILNIYTQFGSIISMTSGALNNGYLPRFFQQLEFNFKTTVKKYFIYILTNTAFITFGVFFIGVFYKFLAKSVNEEYSLCLLLVYLGGIYIYSLKSIGSSYLIFESKTIKIAVFTIISSVLNISVGMIITKYWGFPGCVFSLSFGYSLQMLFFNFDILKRYLTDKNLQE